MGPTFAVAGSADLNRDYDPPVRQPTQALRAAEDLGAQLARQGCQILVHSADLAFIEAFVVRGYVASGWAQPASIHVRGRYRAAEDTNFPDFAGHEELFDIVPEVTSDWEVSYYRSILSADGLIILGGEQSTFVAGLIALSLRIPLTAVATFGGGAEKVWRRLSSEPNFASAADVVTMSRPWQFNSAEQLIASLIAQHLRRNEERALTRKKEHLAARVTKFWLLAGVALLVAALAMIPLAFAWKPGSVASISALLAAPLLSASCGAIMRTAVDQRSEWLRTAVLGAAAGAMAFLLFGAAQLTAAPDFFQGEGSRRLIFFGLPVGFIAGLTFDAVYRKLQAQDVAPTSMFDNR